MARWQVAYDAQIDIWKFWNSDTGRVYALGFANSVERASKVGHSMYTGLPDDADEYDKWRATQSAGNFASLLSMAGGGNTAEGIVANGKMMSFFAEPIYVGQEVMDLVEHAQAEFVPEPLVRNDFFTPSGFMLLPKSYSFLDASLKRSSFRGVGWHPAQYENGAQGVVMSLYSYGPDATNPEIDDYALDLQETRQGFDFPTWGLLHMTPWMFDEPVPTAFQEDQGWWRMIQALFRISQQYISTRSKNWPDRATRKRAARAGIKDDNYITVITLRRPKHAEDSDSEAPRSVEWSHRWIVGGHWRNQYYPSLNAYRQIYIAPYVKGPEDKELQIRKTRVFEVIR